MTNVDWSNHLTKKYQVIIKREKDIITFNMKKMFFGQTKMERKSRPQ